MFDPSDAAQPGFAAYGPAPMPDQRDEEVRAFVEGLMAGGPTQVAKSLTMITERARRVLSAYAERMASLAIRLEDPSLLVGAVVANVLGGLDENRLESLMVMAPIEDSARRLGIAVAELFEQASRVVGHPGTVNLMRWLARVPEDRSLASMGFVAADDPGGFRYRLDW